MPNRVRDGTRLSPLVRKHFKADSYSDWGSAFLLKPLQFIIVADGITTPAAQSGYDDGRPTS